MKRQKMTILLCVFLLVCLTCKVQAYSNEVELDPKGYISMPYSIFNAQGTIRVSSSLKEAYTLFYQKIDVSDTIYNQLMAKNTEQQQYVNSERAKLTTEEANVKSLKTQYEQLLQEEQKEEEQQRIKAEYDKARQEYNQHVDTYNAKLEEFDKQRQQLIPSYQEQNWIQTSQEEDNVQLDFSQYSGEIHFALWAKLVTATNTYYDATVYSTTVNSSTTLTLDKTTATLEVSKTLKLNATTNSKNTITWKSSKEDVATVDANGNVQARKEGITVITATVDGKSATCTITVTGAKDPVISNKTDFSNAKFSYQSRNFKDLEVTIRNFKVKSDSAYYIYLSKESKKTFTSIPEDATRIVVDSENKAVCSILPEKASELLEYTGKNYIYVIEKTPDNTLNVVMGAKEIPNIPLPSLGKRLDIWLYEAEETMVSNSIGLKEGRNITYKIGKITSNSILRAFQKESSEVAYEKLLDYAKKAKYIKTGTISLEGLDYNLVHELNIEQDAYYFIYMLVEDENGKYVTVEDVAIYRENNLLEGNTLVHFDFADIELEGDDTTVVPDTKLPQTGIYPLTIITVVVLLTGSIIIYRKYKKYSDIK